MLSDPELVMMVVMIILSAGYLTYVVNRTYNAKKD